MIRPDAAMIAQLGIRTASSDSLRSQVGKQGRFKLTTSSIRRFLFEGRIGTVLVKDHDERVAEGFEGQTWPELARDAVPSSSPSIEIDAPFSIRKVSAIGIAPRHRDVIRGH